jgi:tRNA pseudouridine13 synthase
VRFCKRELTSPEAAKRLARALGRRPSDVGLAGLKDRHAVTEQWLSVPDVDPAQTRSLAVPGVEVLEARCHPHKLRTGHLKGNRFAVRLVEVGPEAQSHAAAVLAQLEREGMLHLYGPQRFGRGGQNLAEGLTLLRGSLRGGGQRRQRRLLISAVQAALFNDYLARRLEAGSLQIPWEGEVCRREPRGGLFRWEGGDDDPATMAARLAAGELQLTGPLFGPKMRPVATGPAAALEAQTLQAAGLETADFARWRRLAPGGRRPLTVLPREVSVEQPGPGRLWLCFTLPAGAYATVLLREVTKTPFGALR